MENLQADTDRPTAAGPDLLPKSSPGAPPLLRDLLATWVRLKRERFLFGCWLHSIWVWLEGSFLRVLLRMNGTLTLTLSWVDS